MRTPSIEGDWWQAPLAALPLKVGVDMSTLARALGMAASTSILNWCRRRKRHPTSPHTWQPLSSAKAAPLLALLRHGSSEAGAAALASVLPTVAKIESRIGRTDALNMHLYGVAPPQIDYSWALFAARLWPKIRKGYLPPSFKTREEWITFIEAWRHPRDIARTLNMPDPGLPDWNDAEETWEPKPQTTPKLPNPPAGTAGFG